MTAPPPKPQPSFRTARAKAAPTAAIASADMEAQPCFAAWLLAQAARPGALGALAKAAKLDRLFPRNGSADEVRARFSAAGADGDAFEALDDAERTFDRQMG